MARDTEKIKSQLHKRIEETEEWKKQVYELRKQVEEGERRREEEKTRVREEMAGTKEQLARAKERWREKEARTLRDYQENKENAISGTLPLLFPSPLLSALSHHSNSLTGTKLELEKRIAHIKDEYTRATHAREIEHVNALRSAVDAERSTWERSLEAEKLKFNSVSFFINLSFNFFLLVLFFN